MGERDALSGPLGRGCARCDGVGRGGLEQLWELAQRERVPNGVRPGLVHVGQMGAFHDQHQVGVGQRVGVGGGAGVPPKVDPSLGHGRDRPG